MKLQNKLASIFFLSLFMLLPLIAQAGNLVSIIVADTKDSSIGDSVRRDFSNMQSKIAEIAKHTKMKEVKVHLRDSQATSQRVNSALSDLKVGKDDVVIFFYAGHGYHSSSEKKSPWPNMIFSNGGKSISYESVIKNLEKKKPRLLLTIADTCNSLSGGREGEEESRAKPTPTDNYVLEHNYKQLFIETNGTIKVTSSSVGESAWGGKSGGIFTNAFISQLDKAVESRNGIDWKAILKESSKKTASSTSNKNSTQHPYYELKVSK